VNFTREPIIETIITPKEGFRLIVRNTKGTGQEEYSVEALEVVTFGSSYFFRSLERPKAFLVPVSDFEVIETKELRVALKNVAPERTIKIAGGREASLRGPREREREREREPVVAEKSEEGETEAAEGAPTSEPRSDKRRDRHRRRRRRGGIDEWSGKPRAAEEGGEEKAEGAGDEENGSQEPAAPLPPPTFATLLPPPPTLISEKYARPKPVEEPLPPSPIIEEKKKDRDEEEGVGPTSLSRSITTATHEAFSFTQLF
jgi:hypothetical protein